jgi:hypothetical protein
MSFTTKPQYQPLNIPSYKGINLQAAEQTKSITHKQAELRAH